MSSNTLRSWGQYIALHATCRSDCRRMSLARLCVFLFAALSTVAWGQDDNRVARPDSILMAGDHQDARSSTGISLLERQFSVTLDDDSPDEGSTEVNIPDANLRAAVEQALGKESGETITADEMATLTTLDAQASGISDLTGLEFATGLGRLSLANNEIVELSPLSGLTGLIGLFLANNRIEDVSSLLGLTAIMFMDLAKNQIVDVSPLSDMGGLRILVLANNEIEDLSPLSSLTVLSTLSLSNNRIADISPLLSLVRIYWLNLANNQIADISPLSGLSQLASLNLDNTKLLTYHRFLACLGSGGYSWKQPDYGCILVVRSDYIEVADSSR